MNLQTDIDHIQSQLNRSKREWDRVAKHLIDHYEHWERLSKQALNGIVQFEEYKQPQGPILGTVLTKEFRIHFAPLLKGISLYAEAIAEALFTKQGYSVEVARFLVDKDGRILNTDAQPILTDLDDMPVFSLLCNILVSVLQAEAPRD